MGSEAVERPPMVEVAARVDAPVGAVVDLVMARFAGPADPHVRIDRTVNSVALQGGWWYRGEYLVEADGDAARIIHRVTNVATRGRWAVPLANRLFIGHHRKTETAFADFVQAIAAEARADWQLLH